MKKWKPKKPWGEALELLRRGSKNELSSNNVMGVAQYKTACNSKKGSGIDTVMRLLTYWGYTWEDWARAWQQINDGVRRDYEIEDEEWDIRYAQMLHKGKTCPVLKVEFRESETALLQRFSAIVAKYEGDKERAFNSALVMWVDPAEKYGLDDSMRPNVPDRRRTDKVSMVAERTPPYKRRRTT